MKRAEDDEQDLTGVWIAVGIAGAAILCLLIYFCIKCFYDNDDMELKLNNRGYKNK